MIRWGSSNSPPARVTRISLWSRIPGLLNFETLKTGVPGDSSYLNADNEYEIELQVTDAFSAPMNPSGAQSVRIKINDLLETGPEIAVYEQTATGHEERQLNGTIDFGTAIVGGSASERQRTIVVVNEGQDPLTVDFDQITVATPFTYVSGPSSSQSIPAGGKVSFVIELSDATAGTFSEVLTIPNDDSDESPFTLTLTGQIDDMQPDIIVGLDSGLDEFQSGGILDFGVVDQDSTVVREVFISNTGDDDLMITGVTPPPTAEFLIAGTLPASLPFTLLPGESTSLTITVNTGQAGSRSSQLTIASDDNDESSFDLLLTADVRSSTAVQVQADPENLPLGWRSLDSHFLHTSYQGFGGQASLSNAAPFPADEPAVWEFSGLESGEYRVYATWPTPDRSDRSYEASFSLHNGSHDSAGTAQLTRVVNQRLQPIDLFADGVGWTELGDVSVDMGGFLSVALHPPNPDLSTINSSAVIADAVRIELIDTSNPTG